MAVSHAGAFIVATTNSKSSVLAEVPWRGFSIRRTAASEELSIFEQEEVTELPSVRWMDDPPLLKPSQTLQIQLSYTIRGRLEFPPLCEEEEYFLKSAGLE